ncbi:MAG: lysophospholipid acyltransferase family protein [Halothiobacillaceae bacterium]|jgi:1-acyl-sn-glycerol-3-phosphate acyltransferase|nr:lysophospholipid acyltransferase family protein [Halothiobacillaceae bacterium]
MSDTAATRRERAPGVLAFLRSLAFSTGFLTALVAFIPVILFSALLPLKSRYPLLYRWPRFVVWWLGVTCGVRHTVEGREHIPQNGGVVLAKHQSTWETLFLPGLFPLAVFVLKRELLWIPVFGWGLALIKPIAIDRNAKRRALEQLREQGETALREGRFVIIFPEGTRTAAGTQGRYKAGGASLAIATGTPVIPVAHNAGEVWPRRSFIKHPGTVRVIIGAPIPVEGKTPDALNAEVEAWIEARMAQMAETADTAVRGDATR